MVGLALLRGWNTVFSALLLRKKTDEVEVGEMHLRDVGKRIDAHVMVT